MPWRFIGFILVLTLLFAFIALNLGNRVDINVGFTVIEGVPVYFTLFASFILGVLLTLPLTLRARSRRNREKERKAKEHAQKQSTQRQRRPKLRKRGKQSGEHVEAESEPEKAAKE